MCLTQTNQVPEEIVSSLTNGSRWRFFELQHFVRELLRQLGRKFGLLRIAFFERQPENIGATRETANLRKNHGKPMSNPSKLCFKGIIRLLSKTPCIDRQIKQNETHKIAI